MYRITCNYCDEDTIINEKNRLPEQCEHCNTSPFDVKEIVPVESDRGSEANYHTTGFSLKCQKTGEQFQFKHSDNIIIGRSNVRYDEHISRVHCRITFRHGNYFVSDAGSTHGTFLLRDGMKIDCREKPEQVLSDNSILLLGREPFLVNLQPKVKETNEESNYTEPAAENPVIEKAKQRQVFRCMDCGHEVKEKSDICSHCGSFGTIKLIVV